MEYFLTFIEGVLSFISPCVLPLLPIYLSYFAAASTSPGKKKYTIAVNALSFYSGFFGYLYIARCFSGQLRRAHQRIVCLYQTVFRGNLDPARIKFCGHHNDTVFIAYGARSIQYQKIRIYEFFCHGYLVLRRLDTVRRIIS